MENGFSSPCTDEPLMGNPRVHPEGRENYERNTKSSDWFAHKDAPYDPKPEARLRSEAARDIAMKNRGSVQENLQGFADPPIQRTVHPRGVKSEAQEIAESNKGADLKNLIDNYGHLDISARPEPKVKGLEAQEYREREQGSTKLLLDHYSTAPIPESEQPPHPRLGLGGEEVAEKHKGEQMGPLMRLEGTRTPREPKVGRLHQESTGSGWDETPPQHRIRPDGEGIAQKNSADSMGEILVQNGNGIPKVREPKVLKHMAESETPRKTPIHRVRLDGIRNMERARNQSEMSAIMHGSPVEPIPPRPASGKKALPHLQRSELW